MKKSAVVLLLAAAIGAAFLLSTKSNKQTPETESAAVRSKQVESARARRGADGGPESFHQSQLVSNLRNAIATKDQALIEKAFEELVAFIQAHPELTEEYLAALRTEPEEQLLRGLAKAMQ